MGGPHLCEVSWLRAQPKRSWLSTLTRMSQRIPSRVSSAVCQVIAITLKHWVVQQHSFFVQKVLKPLMSSCDFYLCGPQAFVTDIKSTLNAGGANVYVDVFGPSLA